MLYNVNRYMAGLRGFEPLTLVSKTRMIIHFTKDRYLVAMDGIEPPSLRYQHRAKPLSYTGVERDKGIEPSSSAWKAVIIPLY